MLYKFSKWLMAFYLPLVFSCTATISAEVPQVIVSVEPYTFLVERIAGNTVAAKSLVPPTADLHTYEPTPQQMIRASHADLWFRIGETFETRVLSALSAANPHLQVVDLRQGLNLIQGHACCTHCQHTHSEDLHIWLSASTLSLQAQTIADTLIHRYPQHADLYRANLKHHLEELSALDTDLRRILTPMRGRKILVGHPAYGYLFRDYGLQQLPIEHEGRDPTGFKQTQLLQQAKLSRIQAIYTQIQFSPKAAQLVARQLGVPVISLDPFQRDYLSNLRHIAQQIANPQ